MMSKGRVFASQMALFGVIIVALQVSGGAYEAEYDGHADEAAHFVSSLLVRDYIGQWPLPDPLPWASDYYIHYPKVAIGHWPPGYYAMQAAWWLVFPPGRASAMWLNVVMGLGVMGLFLVCGRRIRETWLLPAAGIALLFLPLMQEAHAQVMAELPSVLFVMGLLWGITRFLEQPGWRNGLAVVGVLAGTLAVKGTGVAFLAAPLIALAVSGVWRRIPVLHLLGWPLAGAVGAAALFLWQFQGNVEEILNWGGLRSRILPWGIRLLPDITGAGILLVAAIGSGVALWRREPVLVSALSIVLSMAATGYFVRAMGESRHWIAMVPMLVLLAVGAFAWLESLWRWAPWVAGALLLATFPYGLYRQQPAGFTALAAQLQLPARMLVSAQRGWREGPWIAVVCLRERRPSSTIVRATKWLAFTNWNRYGYRPLVATGEDVERKLDEAAVDVVVLDNALGGIDPSEIRPHHSLLTAMIQASPAWKRCAAARELEAYCRVLPPRFPRQPLRIDLQRNLGRFLEETTQ